MDFSKRSQGEDFPLCQAQRHMGSGPARARSIGAVLIVLGLFFFSPQVWAQAPRELQIEDLPDRRPTPARPVAPLDTIVLDAGHGGLDKGVQGPSGLLEKEVTLKLAQHLGTLLRARLGMRVIQTRTEDVSLPIAERTSLANHAKAQLFISLHLEGAFSQEMEGFRLYTFAPSSSVGVAAERAGPERDESLETILWDLAQTGFSNESARLAKLMAESLERGMGLKPAGITKVPLFILSGAQMPAAVVSPAHLSNANEELILRDDAFLQRVAESLYEAILNFMEGRDDAE